MPQGTPRAKTATHAWCCKCERMVANEDYNKNQAVCRECQKARRRDRYSKGRICVRCSTAPISDYAPRDNCRKCSWVIRTEATRPRRETNPKGYVVVTAQRHPNADARGRIYEHILVMSETLGRPLRPGENVHHKNGVRDDNRPENLELWVTYQPKGQRPADLVAWAHEILARYGEESTP
jgi:hypothetical protein